MAKILISGTSNSGKTTLLKDLKDVLVIANDGKKYPFKQPHVNIEQVTTADYFIKTIEDAIQKYSDKMGKFPTTIAIDSISKVLLDIENYYVSTINSFPYGPIGKDVNKVMSYIENALAKNGCHVIFVSHAIKDQDGDYALVTAGGASGKRGGVIADVDNALYISVKGKKRTIYHKNPKLLSRSLREDLPEEEEAASFNLQVYLEALTVEETETDEWNLG